MCFEYCSTVVSFNMYSGIASFFIFECTFVGMFSHHESTVIVSVSRKLVSATRRGREVSAKGRQPLFRLFLAFSTSSLSSSDDFCSSHACQMRSVREVYYAFAG